MKTLISKRLALSLALCGAVLPLSIVGCGGSNGNGPSKTRPGLQPTTAPTSTAPVALTPTTFTLGNGQRVELTGTRTGTALNGKLKVLNAAPQSRLSSGAQNQAFPFSVAIGQYGYTGTFTPPRGFDIQGNFGSFGSFTMNGQLQTATQNGSYSLTANGVTDTGILPASGTPIPTTAPTTVPGNFAVSGNLAVSNVTAGSPVITSPFNTFSFTPNAGTLTNVSSLGTQSLGFGASDSNPTGNGTRRDIAVALSSAFDSNSGPFTPSLVPFSVNQKFVLGQNFSNLLQYSQATVSGTSIGFKIWRAVSGDVFVRDIGTNSATVELVDVRMRGLNTTGSVDTSAGQFTLNGKLRATGLTVTNQ